MSKIEWTEQTWNPITGCTKVSPGCKHCYAETLALRLQKMGVKGYQYGFSPTIHLGRFNEPLKRKKPTTYFVCSMSDLFQEYVGFDDIERVMEVIEQTPQHTYQILTKRAARMRQFFAARLAPVPGNVWLGVSVEDKQHVLPRIDQLRCILDAPVRFLSCEPLLEDLGEIPLDGIHWVIVGGESGAGARPMAESWVINIGAQCYGRSPYVPFFFKQWGAHDADGKRRSKKANGRTLLGYEWNDMPDSPKNNAADYHGAVRGAVIKRTQFYLEQINGWEDTHES